jgi:putative glutamine amidotransferase|tara:strand:+ start:38097 stop:38852 length:756 start_codon:yes stop_codon:yes gene_type:complete
MIKSILSALIGIFFTGLIHGQEPKYIATAIMKESVVNYVHAIDSNIILIDFMKVKKSKRLELFQSVSGLLLSGGKDVHPSTYGKTDSLKICITHKRRDEVELFLIKNAMKDSLPILGICRGHQIINASLKGELIQDVPSQHEGTVEIIHRDPEEKNYVYHQIELDQDSDLLKLYGKTIFEVNSFHHQAVKVPGDGMKIVAQAEDGLNEASEWAKGLEDRWIIGVQWHPERLYKKEPYHLNIMRGFLSHCRP